VEVGAAQLPVVLDGETFQNGDCVKIVFRPEDVVLSKSDFVRSGPAKLSAAQIEEISFVGAYERVRLRLEHAVDECRTETPFYLTTDTPESQSTKAIIATRPKPDAAATRLQIGDRVIVAISSFTVLPASKS
jgi:hypothetical protein